MVLGIPLDKLFLDSAGLWSLLALLPLIVLYLIRPKPKEKTIPSLMFILRDMGSADKRSFFKKFTKDWLFWLQLLVLLVLCLSVAKPFIMVSEASLAEHTVIVLDTSASMQTKYDGNTRFKAAKDLALENLGSVNTIILARNVPLIVKEEVDSGEAREAIKALEASSTSTAIYDAVRSAIDYAGEGTRVVVISDFIETEVDSDVNTVKKALMARGAVVEYAQIASEALNVGITDLLVGDESTTVQVRNYYPEEKEVVVKIENIEEPLTLKPGESDVVTFSTPKGVNKVELLLDDDFELDNYAFISTPEQTDIDILWITNNDQIESTNMWVAFKAISDNTNYDFNMELAVPPKSIKIDHDLVILKDIDYTKILPGVFRDLVKQGQAKEGGTSVIITAQPGLFSYSPADEILPVIFIDENKVGSDIIKIEPEIESLTKDVNFGHVDYYFNTRPKNGFRNLATTQSDNGSILTYGLGSKGGKVLYYGIFDDDVLIEGKTRTSTFKHDLFYPIFWKRTMDIITDTPSVDSLNQRAGRVVNLPSGEKVETPSGGKVEGIFMLENQGVYTFKNQKIATNLLNGKESDVSGKFSERDFSNIDTEEIIKEKPFSLTTRFLYLGLLLLLLELLYIKFRGDM